jgi:hypothetical protein
MCNIVSAAGTSTSVLCNQCSAALSISVTVICTYVLFHLTKLVHLMCDFPLWFGKILFRSHCIIQLVLLENISSFTAEAATCFGPNFSSSDS